MKHLFTKHLPNWGVKVLCLLFLTFIPVVTFATPLHLKTADAVYKIIEKTYQVNRDGSYTLTVHFKTKILTYKGKKDHADFKYPYNTSYQTVKILKAQTINALGKVIPVDAKEIHDISDPADARASIYSREHVKVVNFPSVEPGTTVEMTFQLHSKRGFWAKENFRLQDPIVKKVVTVSLPSGVSLKTKLPSLRIQETKTIKNTHVIYRWAATNIPKQITEPMLPPEENRGTCLFLSTFSTWKDVARYFQKLLPDTSLKKGLKGIHGTSPDALYTAFMKHVTIYPLDLFHTSLSFQSPSETIKKGYGSQMDLAILFHSLLKSRGYMSEFLLMNSDGVILKGFTHMPMPSLFDDVLVRCGGHDYAFYAKDLPPGFTGAEGQLLLDLKTGRLTPAIRRYANRSETTVTLVPTASFTIEGVFSSRSEGEQAVSMRSWLKYETKDEWAISASRILHDLDPIARLEGKITRKGLKTLTAPVILKGRFIIPRPFPGVGDWTFVLLKSPNLPGGMETLLKTRRGPIMISEDYTERLDETVTLPEGVIVRRVPPNGKGASACLDWVFYATPVKNHLKIQRRIHLKRGILMPGTEAYYDFIRAITALYSPVNRLIVLERMPRK